MKTEMLRFHHKVEQINQMKIEKQYKRHPSFLQFPQQTKMKEKQLPYQVKAPKPQECLGARH